MNEENLNLFTQSTKFLTSIRNACRRPAGIAAGRGCPLLACAGFHHTKVGVIPTRRHLHYASGFIELGMLRDAAKELRAIAKTDQRTPKVLTVWIDLHMHARRWKPLIAVSRQLVRAEPQDDKGWISWAFGLRELNQVEAARAVLLKAMPLHGKTCSVLHYNLACYECLLGNLPQAKRHLKIAADRDKEWRESALADTDLEALWPEIRAQGP